MPFKSQAQRRKFYAMADSGEMPRATVERWEDETPKGKKLPERVKKKASAIEHILTKHALVTDPNKITGHVATMSALQRGMVNLSRENVKRRRKYIDMAGERWHTAREQGRARLEKARQRAAVYKQRPTKAMKHILEGDAAALGRHTSDMNLAARERYSHVKGLKGDLNTLAKEKALFRSEAAPYKKGIRGSLRAAGRFFRVHPKIKAGVQLGGAVAGVGGLLGAAHLMDRSEAKKASVIGSILKEAIETQDYQYRKGKVFSVYGGNRLGTMTMAKVKGLKPKMWEGHVEGDKPWYTAEHEITDPKEKRRILEQDLLPQAEKSKKRRSLFGTGIPRPWSKMYRSSAKQVSSIKSDLAKKAYEGGEIKFKDGKVLEEGYTNKQDTAKKWHKKKYGVRLKQAPSKRNPFSLGIRGDWHYSQELTGKAHKGRVIEALLYERKKHLRFVDPWRHPIRHRKFKGELSELENMRPKPKNK